MGGVIWPPVEATASTAAASAGGYPSRFISGIVRVPVVATLATALPLTVPKAAEAMVAILAAPPTERPDTRSAMSINAWPPPVCKRTAPNNTKAAIMVAARPVSIPPNAQVSQINRFTNEVHIERRMAETTGNKVTEKRICQTTQHQYRKRQPDTAPSNFQYNGDQAERQHQLPRCRLRQGRHYPFCIPCDIYRRKYAKCCQRQVYCSTEEAQIPGKLERKCQQPQQDHQTNYKLTAESTRRTGHERPSKE